MVQICFRVPADVADFIREMSEINNRQPGAELARMIRPIIETEKRRRAWEQQQQQASRPQEADQKPSSRRSQKKTEGLSGPLKPGAEPDLFASAEADQATGALSKG